MSYAIEIKLNRHLHDLNPLIVGLASCPPGDRTALIPSPCTLVHYVVSGKGVLYSKGTAYPVSAGQCFIIPPNEPAPRIADEEDPWTYQWIGFNGSLSSHFWRLGPVFSLEEPPFPHVKNLKRPSPNLAIELTMDLFGLYTKLVLPERSDRSLAPDYVQAVIDYIQSHYKEPLTIRQITEYVGLSQDYLCRLFKQQTGISIQSQLLETRKLEAKRLLRLGHSVEETAALCGFHSISHFSRQFKRLQGMSPKQWLKYSIEAQSQVKTDL